MKHEIIFSIIVFLAGVITLFNSIVLFFKGISLLAIFTFILGISFLIWAGAILIKKNYYHLIRGITAHVIVILELADLVLRKSYDFVSIGMSTIFVVTLIYIAYFYDFKYYFRAKDEDANKENLNNPRFNSN